MKYWTYITTNEYNRVLYTGVTGDIKGRMQSHKTKKYMRSFTARYNAYKLVWFQEFTAIREAYNREKQLKAGSRQKKVDIVNKMNPEWLDLTETLLGI